MVAAMRRTDRASSQPASMNCMGQNPPGPVHHVLFIYCDSTKLQTIEPLSNLAAATSWSGRGYGGGEHAAELDRDPVGPGVQFGGRVERELKT
jgi:hypothetical protein